MRKTLLLPDDMPIHVIFLTPGRERAMNPSAVPSTFVEFLIAVAGALESFDRAPGTLWAYRMLFTHLLANASPISGDTLSLVQTVARWSAEFDWAEPEAVARRLPDLTRACHLLLPGEWNG